MMMRCLPRRLRLLLLVLMLMLMVSAGMLVGGGVDAVETRKQAPRDRAANLNLKTDSTTTSSSSSRVPARREFFSEMLTHAGKTLGESLENPCAGKSRGPGEPFTFFLVLFMGRSGSSAFMSEVAQHDEVLVPGYEPWNSHRSDVFSTLTEALLTDFVDDGIALANRHGCRAMGFKFRWTQLTRQVLEKNRDRWSPLFFQQDRWNILGRAISGYSHFVGAATQMDRSRGIGPAPPLQITDWDRLHEEVRRAIETSDKLRTEAGYLGAEGVFFYEEYLLKHENTMTRFFSRIHVDPEQHNASFVAGASSVVLCERVANYQEVCDRFWCHSELNHHFLVDVWFGCTCAPVPVCGEP